MSAGRPGPPPPMRPSPPARRRSLSSFRPAVRARRVRGRQHGRGDLRVGRAAADVAAHPLPDAGVVARVPLGDAGHRRYQLARGAVAALEGVVLGEGLLDRVQLPARSRQALHGGDLPARALHDQGQAAVHPAPVDQHGAGAAGALVAALLGPGEPRFLAQPVEQGGPGRDDGGPVAVVDPQRDLHAASEVERHCRSLPGRGPPTEGPILRYTGSSRIRWPGMASVYAVLEPGAGVTRTGAHQVGIDFGGHRGLVREVDGRARRYDAEPGAVYVTGPSPITWLEVSDPTEALEVYPDRALVDRLAAGLGVTAEVRPSFGEPDGVVFAVAARLRRAHLAGAHPAGAHPAGAHSAGAHLAGAHSAGAHLAGAHLADGALTDVEAGTLAHRLAGHLLRQYGAGRGPRPGKAGELRPGAVDVVTEYTRAHLASQITLD